MSKRRYEQCKHVRGAFDEIVFVDLECKNYTLCHGFAIVTKHMCQYCPCMEKKKDVKIYGDQKPKALTS